MLKILKQHKVRTCAYRISFIRKVEKIGTLSTPELIKKLKVASLPDFANQLAGLWLP
jgi:hypothetical protein